MDEELLESISLISGSLLNHIINMAVDVKICGLNREETLDAALKAGADYVGFVFFPRSPRHVSIEQASHLVDLTRGRSKSVVLLVNPSDDEIDAVIDSVNPDVIQLHGDETPKRVREIRDRINRPIIKAIGVAERQDIAKAHLYDDIADLILFDAKPAGQVDTELPGGNGVPFDWRLLQGVHKKHQFMLSGGLNPDNVRAAIELTDPAVVDVSSGVESAPGKKDCDLIVRFINEVRKAAPNVPNS